MITLREPAYAKVNLTLDVLAKRPDGYHDLESIFQAVSLRDEILLTLGTGESWDLICSDPQIPCDRRNLVWKAAELFCQETGFDPKGLHMEIRKQIPSQAGLGGGSADAAAVLRVLNRCLEKPLSLEALAQMGAKVGSDVPFCVIGGSAFAEGRGERLSPLGTEGKLHYVLVKPSLSFSTPELFRKIDNSSIPKRPNHEAMTKALENGDPVQVGEQLCNVFEYAVLEDYPEIGRIKELLLSHGAVGAQMTGSGSVVFAIFQTEGQAQQAHCAIASEYPDSYCCTTV